MGHLVANELAHECVAEARRTGGLISAQVARTIASWFQTPGGYGAVFAELSTTGNVRRLELEAAITREVAELKAFPDARTAQEQREQLRALYQLRRWVRNPSAR